jgi:hypothetical protein
MPTQVTFFFLFLAVLALIAGVFWLFRRFAGSRLGSNANRGRLPRLAVIDAAAVDGRRRLVLVRRDNVEHLLMIGGPSDIVIEPNIVRATPQREPGLARGGPAATDLPPRVALPDTDRWNDAGPDLPDLHEPVLPELPQRPARPAFADEVRRPASAAADRRINDPLAGMISPEPALRPEPPVRPEPPQRSRPLPRSERNDPVMPRGEPLPPRNEPALRAEPPMPRAPAFPPEPIAKAPRPAERPAPPPPPAPTASADQNLAEMAQRLEAALRRPVNETPDRAPPVAPEAPARAAPLRAPETAPASSAAPPVPPPAPKISLDNLEDEMASLLGRPKSPT